MWANREPVEYDASAEKDVVDMLFGLALDGLAT